MFPTSPAQPIGLAAPPFPQKLKKGLMELRASRTSHLLIVPVTVLILKDLLPALLGQSWACDSVLQARRRSFQPLLSNP